MPLNIYIFHQKPIWNNFFWRKQIKRRLRRESTSCSPSEGIWALPTRQAVAGASISRLHSPHWVCSDPCKKQGGLLLCKGSHLRIFRVGSLAQLSSFAQISKLCHQGPAQIETPSCRKFFGFSPWHNASAQIVPGCTNAQHTTSRDTPWRKSWIGIWQQSEQNEACK